MRCLALVGSFLVLGGAGHLAHSQDEGVEPHGGAGGGPFDFSCRTVFPDGVLVGFSIHKGAEIDHIEPVCAAVSSPANTKRSGKIFGGEGGEHDQLQCDSGQVVRGIFGRSGERVDKLGIICGLPRPPRPGMTIFRAEGSNKVGPEGGEGGGDFRDDMCPHDQIANGVRGRKGERLDQIELRCWSE
jgi:hypothetical protein